MPRFPLIDEDFDDEYFSDIDDCAFNEPYDSPCIQDYYPPECFLSASEY